MAGSAMAGAEGCAPPQPLTTGGEIPTKRAQPAEFVSPREAEPSCADEISVEPERHAIVSEVQTRS